MSLAPRRAAAAPPRRRGFVRPPGDADFSAAALSAVSEGIIIIGTDGRVRSINDAAASLSQWTARDAINRPADDVVRLLDESTSAPIPLPAPTLQRAADLADGGAIALFASRDGSLVPVRYSISTARRGGQAIGVVITLNDVREHRERDHTLRRVRAELSHAQKLEAAGLLVGGVSHDFANVLTVIVGETEHLLANKALDRDTSAALNQVLDAACRGAGIVRQLLAFARRESVEPQVVNLRAIVDDSAPIVRHLVGPSIRVRLLTDSDTPPVRVQPGEVQMLLVNLAVNARDAMPEGGVLTITAGYRSFDLSSRTRPASIPPGTYAALSVRDTGTGISPADLCRIFDPFFTTKTADAGTGLGLSLVQTAVKQAGGHLHVESRLGHGSCFSIYIPAATPGSRRADL